MNDERLDIPEARRLQLPALLLGLVAAIVCAIGAVVYPQWFYPAYLVGYLFWLGIALGSMAVAMIHHLSGGGWGLPIRRVLEAAYSTLPLLAVLFLPVVLGMRVLYPWMDAAHVEHDAILQWKSPYLNQNAFLIRAALYFAVWILLGLVLNFLSSGRDEAHEVPRERRLALLSGPGLIAWVLSVTFASVDWVMSLEPHWFSSMYGVLHIAGFGVSGLAMAIVTIVALRERPPWNETLLLPRLNDLGNFLLAFTLFWSYVSLMQYLIIWSANLPEETPWYLARSRGGWQAVAIALIGLHFVLPFLLLLVRMNKRNPRRIAGIALLLLAMRLVDLYWLVIPASSPGKLAFNPLALVTPLAVGGLWLAWFCWRLPLRAAIPVFEIPPHEEPGDELARQPAH